MENTEVKAAEKELAKVTETPRILTDGDVYAVRSYGKFFSSFDEDGHAWVSNNPRYLHRKQAAEIASKIGQHAEIIRIVPDNDGEIHFWLDESSSIEPHSASYGKRTIHVGTPVRSRFDQIPGWFKAAMMKFSPQGSVVTTWDDEEYDDGMIALEVFSDEAGHGLHRWLDHEGWTGEGENSVFVSEPYHLEQEDLLQLIEVCKKFGFTFTISGKSEHYPSSTFRIEITPIEKLPYIRPVRVMGAEQKAWEDQRSQVFYGLVRNQAADYIEHVLHVVNPSWMLGEVRVIDFIKSCLITARCYADGHDNETLLVGYHDSAGKKYRQALRDGLFDKATMMILHAVEYLLAPNGRYLCNVVKTLCADAVQDFTERKHEYDFADSMKPYKDELKWQEAHSKEAWDKYAAEWGHDYKETI
jgi:hypothetical protein